MGDDRPHHWGSIEQTEKVRALLDQTNSAIVTWINYGILPVSITEIADYFCTCDDRFSRQAKAVSGLRTRVVSPLELIEAIEA